MNVEADIPGFVGVHHLKLPVRDLARSEAWYGRTLGYRRAAEFVERGC
ncbi:VOC family protein [Stenotrophomonas sp. NPDC087984]